MKRRWISCILTGSFALQVWAQDAPVVSTNTTPAPPAASTPTVSSPAPQANATPASVPPSITSSTPTYSIETSTPTPEESEQESKRISRLDRILKIRTEGNRNVRERVILAQVKTKKNDLYDPDKLRKDVQAIYGLGNFEDTSLEVTDVPGGVIVTFKVVEKPMIKKIDFKGNKKVGSSKLRDGISLKENDPLDKFKLNLDVEKILSIYKDEGFAAAQVEPFTTTDTTNHVTITFFVTEGTQVLVDQVDIQGVTAFKLKKVKKLMKTRHKKVFKQDVLTKDIEDITKFYKNHGYQNIKVLEPKQTFNTDKTRITISVTIEEGPLFHFGASKFSGNAIFPTMKLDPAIQYKPGEIYNQDKMDSTIAKLQDIYGAQGYIRVQVKPDYAQDTTKGIVDTTYQITEGEVVYVDHIGIEGNTHTKDFVIRREIKLKEGDPFSSVLARKSVERLYNLGFLDNVDVDVQQPNSPNKADVIFTVTEGKPGVLSAGAGYSSVDGLIGTLQLQHINFLGRGQRINMQWQFGARTNSFDVGWTDPWFLGKPMTLSTDIFNTIRVQQLGTITNDFTTRDRGGSVTIGPRFSDIYSLSIGYSFASQLRYNVAPDPESRAAVLSPECAADPLCDEFHAIYSNFTEQFVRDTRDNQFDPQRGTRSSLAVIEGGAFPANSVKFYKPILDESIHIPTFWKFVLSLHGQWSYIEPYGDSTLTDIQTQLFHLGGSDTVRGYSLGAVGVSGVPGNPGGQVMNLYNVEYKFPIAPDEHGKTLLQGVFFYDIGGDWENFQEVNYNTGSGPFNLKQGVGFGIRFKTPVFPLRLDWGHALNAAPGESRSQFYFTVGSLF
jgi:outer membrane protein insertion porin family